MRIHAVIATTGRPEIVRRVVLRIGAQSRPADGVVVVGASPNDITGLEGTLANLETLVSPRGLCRQRNAALDHLDGKSDVVVFFDDDFVPAFDFLARLEGLLRAQPDIVGATGVLVADGAQGQPIGFDEAVSRLDGTGDRPPPDERDCLSLYGCNMAIRMSAAQGRKVAALWLAGGCGLYPPVELAGPADQDQPDHWDPHGRAQRKNIR
jgi:hypothetical protein